MQTYDVIMVVVQGLVQVDEVPLYSGLSNRLTGEALIEDAGTDPLIIHVEHAMRRKYGDCVVAIRMRIHN